LLSLASSFVVTSPFRSVALGHTGMPAISMAHHVQKKATKKHQDRRPKKSRPSDINRKPPVYPPIPDIPDYTILDSETTDKTSLVTLDVSPEDDVQSLKHKLQAAGTNVPQTLSFGGRPVFSTLAECGLDAATTVEARVVDQICDLYRKKVVLEFAPGEDTEVLKSKVDAAKSSSQGGVSIAWKWDDSSPVHEDPFLKAWKDGKF